MCCMPCMENSIAYITQAKISQACTHHTSTLKIKIRLKGLLRNTLILAYACMKMACIFQKGSLDKADWLTTTRDDAPFPTWSWIHCVAPESTWVVRVSTVVAGVCDAVVRKHVVLIVAMLVWRLRRPGLTSFASLCYRPLAHVQTSFWCRVAVFCTML